MYGLRGKERGVAIADLSKVLDALGQSSSSVESSLKAVTRARAHTRQVEQSLGRKGLRRMAAMMAEVVTGLGKVGQALLTEQESLAKVSTRVAELPTGASADEVLAALEPASKELSELPGRLYALAGPLDHLRRVVATTLKGAQPGPLLGRLEAITTSLDVLADSASTAVRRASDLTADTRAAGGQAHSAAGAASPAPAAGADTSDRAEDIVLSSDNPAHVRRLNKPPANATIVVDGRFRYETDDQGRVVKATATLETIDLEHPRSEHAQKTLSGKLPGDDAGHLFARIFKGPGQKLNLVPMEALGVNRGKYKSMESKWRQAIEDGHEVRVEVELFYPDNSRRPRLLVVEYAYGGVERKVAMKNTPKETE